MRIHQDMLQCLLLYVVVIVATAEANVEVLEFPSNSYGDYFTNMAVFEGKVYVGAKNYIYVLDATDLSQMQRVWTCAESTKNCYFNNKVLLVNEKLNQLITCGTRNSGVCEIRYLKDIKNVLSNSSRNLAVSFSESRPAIFVLNEKKDGFYTGVTYDLTNHLYDLYIANFSISTNAFIRESYMELEVEPLTYDDYTVYFKAGFNLNGFIYFFTQQKYEARNNIPLTSKIIRICQGDGRSRERAHSFWSYTDIPLECNKDGKVYSLVQDVTAFKPGEQLLKEMNVTAEDWIIAATITSRLSPVESAVCLYKLSDIDQHIMTAKRDFITCQPTQFSGSRYLLDRRAKICLNSTDYDQHLIQKVPCNTLLGSFTYVIGGTATKILSQAVYTSNFLQHGVFGKIKAKSIGEYTVVYVGTSKGQLIKLNVNSEDATVYEESEVDGGHPITALHLEDDGQIYYAMSNRKLVRYESRSGNEYSTCEATMEARNPLCGWCAYQNRSTMKDNSSCPYQLSTGHWLSSLTQCLRVDVHPKGLAVPGIYNVDVFFTGLTPDLISGYEYACEIRAGRSQISNKNFTCKTPRIDAHTEGRVLLYVETPSNKRVLLAQTDLLFYDCGHYSRCGECLRDPRANCSWNSHTTTCVPLNDSSDIFIQKNGPCSSFQNNEDRLYLPSGVQKILIFNVTNLVNTYVSMNYSCKLNGKVFSAQRLSDSQIYCTLQETTSEKEIEYKLEILYGTSALDGENTVVVYNCGNLGSDCSLCSSLKYGNPNYVCYWCSGHCVHPESPCSITCGPPTVTGVLPNTAGLDGNITVTIYGQEMGSRFEDVDSITLAGIACEPQHKDFLPSTRVTCKAGRSGNITGGNVTMVVKNKTSAVHVRFDYKMPLIDRVLPTKGPLKGGTRLTIRGQDLGIGTRIVKVNVTIWTGVNSETKECTDAEVMPKLSLNNTSEFQIECDTPEVTTVGSTFETVTITFDGGTVTSLKNIDFKYRHNPEMYNRDLNNIASGGIKQTITGKKFMNANKGFVSMKCLTETKIQDCIIESNTTMTCKVPELCEERKNELINRSRRKRETGGSGVVDVEIIIHLDGVQQKFSIFYYSDPSFNPFDEDSKVKLFESKNKKLTIRGSNLNLVAGEDDVIVTVGVGNCDVIELREINLTCVAPNSQPAPGVPGANFPEVNVTIGNVHGNLGYLQYVEKQEEQAKQWIIIVAVVSSLLAVFVIILVVLLVKYKRKFQ